MRTKDPGPAGLPTERLAASTEGAAMSNGNAGAAGGGVLYALGIVGAIVYFWQQADSFGEHLLAVLQGLVWPAIMVYEGFRALAG